MKVMKKSGFSLLGKHREMHLATLFQGVKNPLFFMTFMASW